MPADNELDTQLQQFKLNVTSDDILEMLSTTHIVSRTSVSSLSNSNYNNDNDEDMDDDVEEIPVKQTRASTAIRGGRARGRGSKAKAASNNSNNSRSPASRPAKHIMPVLETSRATVRDGKINSICMLNIFFLYF